jgi:hypothetical protein
LFGIRDGRELTFVEAYACDIVDEGWWSLRASAIEEVVIAVPE